ncbi:hypothetical protein HOM50_04450 [bacterium]|jgi:hypothetical protein|nr:hypothetical protein [bacterium]MBT5015630.1 hypothetical protein [bacterium]
MRFSCIKNNIKYFVLMVILCGLSIELQAMAGARRGLTSVARNYRTLVNRASVPMSRFSSAATGAMHKGATQTRMSAQKFSTMAEGALGNTPFDVKVLEFVNNYHGVAESIYDVTNERPSSSLLQQFWRFSLGFKALSNIKTSNIKTSGIPLASKKAFDGFYHDLIKEKSVTVEQQA